jgi:hypothetical protein
MRRNLSGRAAAFGVSALLVAALVLILVAWVPWAESQRLAGPAPEPFPERLPDLDQETPRQLEVETKFTGDRRTYWLGFRSAVRNVGDGPLIVVGSRPDTAHPYMIVDQLIHRIGAEREVVPNVGRMKYVVSPDHQHWHYLGFEHYALQTYELRAAESSRIVATDSKTGFCLGDRYRVPTPLPAAPREPVFTGGCGLKQTKRLRIREGISVGYGDDYSAFLEGQDLPLDGLRGGRYVLVHRVNEDHGLRELSYANNAASVLLDLRWHEGEPYLRVLRTCPRRGQCDSGSRFER